MTLMSKWKLLSNFNDKKKFWILAMQHEVKMMESSFYSDLGELQKREQVYLHIFLMQFFFF